MQFKINARIEQTYDITSAKFIPEDEYILSLGAIVSASAMGMSLR
jgi:hypothetical protein